jgi:hypothetical protein
MEFLPQFETAALVFEQPDELRWVLSTYRRTRSSQTFGESPEDPGRGTVTGSKASLSQ